MTEVLHANIFFVIASVATVVFSLLVCLAMYQVIKILRAVRRLVERVESGSEVLMEDVAQFRSFVMKGSFISQLIGFFMSRGGAARSSRKKD
jgi:hypothetical protein